MVSAQVTPVNDGTLLANTSGSSAPMKSPHIVMSLMSLGLMLGLARAVPSIGMSGVGADAMLVERAQQQLSQQPTLVARIRPLLPRGTDPARAASGFGDLGEFISTVHVSDNLDIPFDELKSRVTGPDGRSLGDAIRELRPTANPTVEIKRAREQARRDQSQKPG
jgi:hypothetical protein